MVVAVSAIGRCNSHAVSVAAANPRRLSSWAGDALLSTLVAVRISKRLPCDMFPQQSTITPRRLQIVPDHMLVKIVMKGWIWECDHANARASGRRSSHVDSELPPILLSVGVVGAKCRVWGAGEC